MAAVIANEFTEADTDLYLDALVEIGLVLFVITLFVNILSRALIWSMTRSFKKAVGAGAAARRAGARRMTSATWRKVEVGDLRQLLRAVDCGGAGAARVHLLLRPEARALQALNYDFFTQMPKPVGETGGGMANAIVGTLIIVGLGALFAIPTGIMSGVYLSEYAGTRLSSAVRFAADTLNGVPSIVIGMFIYTIAVLPVKQFSALAGGLALGVMMIPIIARTTEELLLLVPGSMREGSLALGATRAQATFTVVLPAALPGILTGVVLALARIAGETAPLLFTVVQQPLLQHRRSPSRWRRSRSRSSPTPSRRTRTGTARRGPARSCWSPSSSSARSSPAWRPAASRKCAAGSNMRGRQS